MAMLTQFIVETSFPVEVLVVLHAAREMCNNGRSLSSRGKFELPPADCLQQTI